MVSVPSLVLAGEAQVWMRCSGVTHLGNGRGVDRALLTYPSWINRGPALLTVLLIGVVHRQADPLHTGLMDGESRLGRKESLAWWCFQHSISLK